ncbi:MAG: SDR family oxidoreductase [Steroidobacteraceae bacterium]|jgi:NAD(P)-dependent dehydrogenase (short-subunit alcohol dehydrogenase family)|nr:SDR family oxidoreductase [Steroidobacteraceae bacterium]
MATARGRWGRWATLALASLALLPGTAPAPAAAQAPPAAAPAPAAGAAPVVLVTGSNRGIGLEFVRQYAQKGWTVIATARDPANAPELQALAARHRNVSLETLDVADSAQVAALAAKYRGRPVDVLLHNAGWLGERDKQSLENLDYATFEEVLRVNTFAPLEISRAFMENVLASSQKKIVVITSGLSSQANTRRGGGLYFYRISKAGVNMAMRTLAAETRDKGLKVGILAPGMVETRLLRASGYPAAGIPPQQSVAGVIRNIENLTQDAEIVLWDGSKVPW